MLCQELEDPGACETQTAAAAAKAVFSQRSRWRSLGQGFCAMLHGFTGALCRLSFPLLSAHLLNLNAVLTAGDSSRRSLDGSSDGPKAFTDGFRSVWASPSCCTPRSSSWQELVSRGEQVEPPEAK
jgi:hypothetical protein